MDRIRLATVCLFVLGSAAPAPVLAQHHGHHFFGFGNGFWPSSGATYVSPVVGGQPFWSPFSGGSPRNHHHRDTSHVQVTSGPIWIAAPVVVPVVPVVNVTPIVFPTVLPIVDDPAKTSPKVSSAGAKLKSLEHQGRGDDKLRKRLWAQAYMHYRSAIDVAGDRAEARFRQAFTYTAMQHFESAVREFKRGLSLDASMATKGIGLAELFGPDTEALRTSMIHKVIDWVGEDDRDADRWFLLGLMLHFEDDPRSRDMLKTAKVLAAGEDSHIRTLLNAEHEKPAVPAKPPFLPQLPVSPVIIDGEVATSLRLQPPPCPF